MPSQPPKIRRPAGLITALALLLGAAVAGPASSAVADPTPAATGGAEYVALGDSYAAGYGLAMPTGEPVAACGQSALDYPHLVADRLGLDLDDVSCAGATTADIVRSEQHGAPIQSSALGLDTRVVTVTIGGNDAGLYATAGRCVAVSAVGPVLATGAASCRSSLVTAKGDSLGDSIRGPVTAGLRTAFRVVAEKAPNAVVIVVGYPALFPDTEHTPEGGCFRPVVSSSSLTEGFPANGFPFTDVDVRYLAGVQAELDKVTRTEAHRAGLPYVSTLSDSEIHSGCATADSYIEGITLTASPGLSSIDLQRGALHPNTAGTEFLASATAAAVAAALRPTATPSPGSADGGGFDIDLLWLVLAGLVVIFVVIVLLAARGIRRAVDERGPRGRQAPDRDDSTPGV